MKERAVPSLVFLLTLLSMSACGPAAGPGGPLGSRPIRFDAGTVTAHDLEIGLPRVLMRHGYLITWTEARAGDMVMETQWKPRDLFQDEAAAGIAAARTRFILRAVRQKDRSLFGELYSLRLEADNLVAVDGDGEWHRDRGTPSFESYVRQLASEIRAEISTTMRVK